ncbi:hypothetical protein BACCIP111895_00080 [Neobacillus rhizosphaerae]|uniref:Uncharacterized protein n=1 Tax=Neobacillus rhizosphaerae TaxID=2880965 RepID=A0ABM9EK43_9BACI|nr:hypothetical protein [Neobacillus rhizosphaerae]CAH2712947.1 hypothetical protein BACCIP111895_00080 [Neobacillus rhizosphaerae]
MQTIKKLESEEMNNDNQIIMFVQKVKNNMGEQWNRVVNSNKESWHRNFQLFQKVDGISLWKINYQLNRLAVKGISKEVLKKGKIILSLPSKQMSGATSDFQKAYIERTIDELEGFENLRLSHFYNYKPVYVEKKGFAEVSRWIEIEITEL